MSRRAGSARWVDRHALGSRAHIRDGLILLFLALGCGAPVMESGSDLLDSNTPDARPGTSGDAPDDSARVSISDGWLAMGTFFELELRVDPTDEARGRDWIEFARSEIRRLEAIYSRHDASSELSRLNRLLEGPTSRERASAFEAGSSEIQIGRELANLVSESLAFANATGGVFDPTIRPLALVWETAARRGSWPTPDEVAKARALGGYQRLRVDPSGRLSVDRDSEGRGPTLDLDGLSKGAVLDHLRADFLARFAGAAALLNFGQSSVVAIGAPAEQQNRMDRKGTRERCGAGWRLIARSRDPDRSILGEFRLEDRALAVSSSVGRTIEIGGRRASHILDPRTGSPVEGSIEAIVIGDRALHVDAWSTALTVWGRDRSGLDRARVAGLEAIVIDEASRADDAIGQDASGPCSAASAQSRRASGPQ